MKHRLAFAALLISSTAALSATAQQPWIQDRRLGEGAGIRTGNLELHPSLAGEAGYDSNYFQRGPEDAAPVVDSMRFRVTPSLTLSTLGRERTEGDGPNKTPPLIDFDLAGYATYNAFVPLDDVNDFDDRSRLSGGLRFGLELFPKRPFTWDLSGRYQRSIDPSDIATGDRDFDRHLLRAGTGLTWRPGGGLFDWRVGYGFYATYFSEGSFDVLNNNNHTFETRGRWRFLPRTALLYDGFYRLVRYTDPSSPQPDGDIIQSRIGVNGLITNRFAFRVMGGWAASFFEPPPNFGPAENFDGPVGNAELKFFLTPNPRLQPGSAPVGLSSVALGYDRNYAQSYLGPYYQRDRGYLTFEYFIGGIIVTSLRGQVARNSYPTFGVGDGMGGVLPVDVHETRLGATLFAEYRVTSNFGINTTIEYDKNIAGGDNPIPVVDDDLDYSRFQAYLGARVFW